MESANKTVDEENQEMREIYAKYDLEVSYYSYSKPIAEDQPGYRLSWFSSDYDLSAFLSNPENMEAGTDISITTFAEFQRIKNSNEQCAWMDPPAYCYYYLTDNITGDIYIIDYDAEAIDPYDPEIAMNNSLKTFLALLAGK